ncbi:MAG: molecular chaperone DnaJ [Candidatus Paceibacterota bacterium]|jgi:molecular chaperone DnaJ
MKNYYDILGIQKGSSKDEIKTAFRKLAHKYHPDKDGGDEAKFKEVSEAYSILSDDKKRQEYDMYGRTGAGGGGGAGGFGGFNPNDFQGFDFSQFTGGGSQFQDFDIGDIFGDIFGGGGGRTRVKRGRDISVDVEISFSESVFGTDKKIVLEKASTCDICHGTGAEKGTELKKCPTCDGNGKVREVKRTIFGQQSSIRECVTCKGTGTIPKTNCSTCRGSGIVQKRQELQVKIPSGIESGETLRVTGSGEAISGGAAGDLYIKVHVTPHSVFRKEGNNLIMDLEIKLSDALLGGEQTVHTLDGDVTVKIPEGITFGEILRIKGKGVPTGGRRGDILMKIKIHIPRKLSRDTKKKIEELKKEGL